MPKMVPIMRTIANNFSKLVNGDALINIQYPTIKKDKTRRKLWNKDRW